MAGINRQPIRAFNGRTIGYIDTLPNGDKEIRDSSGRYLGKYDKKLDTTKDYAGRLLYRGDQSSMLLNRK